MNGSLAKHRPVDARDNRGPSTSRRTTPATPFELCVALIHAQRDHARLIGELEEARALQRRGLVYREGIHSDRQFAEAYLAHQRGKIERTLGRLEASRVRANALIELAEATPASPLAVSAGADNARFSARLRRDRRRAPAPPAGADRSLSLALSR